MKFYLSQCYEPWFVVPSLILVHEEGDASSRQEPGRTAATALQSAPQKRGKKPKQQLFTRWFSRKGTSSFLERWGKHRAFPSAQSTRSGPSVHVPFWKVTNAGILQPWTKCVCGSNQKNKLFLCIFKFLLLLGKIYIYNINKQKNLIKMISKTAV